MRLPVALLFTLTLAASAAAQAPPHVEEAAIRKQAEAYAQAYNAHDAAKVASFWSKWAVYLDSETGERIAGREAIEKMFAENFAADPASRIEVTIDSIRLITADAAVEDGTATIASQGAEPTRTTYTAVHVKQDGQWLLDSVRETVLPQPPPAPLAESYENLQHLKWMVGEWVDESEESTVETSCRWAKNKSFLTRTFKVSAPGWDELEGTQIIGWDPQASAIRVWVFDSDGGYAEGVASRHENGAVVEVRGFTPDGRTVSAVQVYAKLDDNTFSYRSTNRFVGNEQLPDLAEVRVVRKPAATE